MRYEMTWEDFKAFLRDFQDLVWNGSFQKMEYRLWRCLNSYPHSDNYYLARVLIEKCGNEGFNLNIDNKMEYHYFHRGDNSFGDFFFENFLDKEIAWDYLVEASCRIPSTGIKIDVAQAESYNNNLITMADTAYTNMKDTLAQAHIGIHACPIESDISISIDTKVDKAEFEARIEELTEIIKKHTDKDEKENENMKGFNFDFGPVSGNAVRLSMYGLAVKNKTGTYVSYDAVNGEIMDVDIFNFEGANFLYKMPVAMKDIAIGDVVIHHGAPMFVIGKSEDGKGLMVVDVVAGERKEVMLAKSPFGFNFATKVVNFLGNAFNGGATAENPFGNMWMLMMMGDNKDMKDILPLMLMAGGNMDMSNPLMLYALMGDGKMDPVMLMAMSGAFNPTPAHECKCSGNCNH